MPAMLGCGVMLAVALVLAVRWRSYSLDVPAGDDEDSTPGGRAVRALTCRLCVGAYAGVLTGLFVVGPGGRLVMRLLAATSPEAQGRLTEAEAVVGDITVGGTVFFVVFMSIAAAGIGLLYAVLEPALPRGLPGGALFGAGLLVVFGSTIDPLRSDNPDFGIVGPGWLAIVAFTTLAIATGCFTAVAAARIGAAVPRPDSWSFSAVLAGRTDRGGGGSSPSLVRRSTGDAPSQPGAGTALDPGPAVRSRRRTPARVWAR
ncbi:hypothetical protein ACFQW6_16410 [Nocardioides sp. GCM10028917]|uniref:hypothetical protein n=1 Tax=Nocardioides sp. GCM10028917 TaxID=3273408 RepID=UPI00360C5D1F